VKRPVGVLLKHVVEQQMEGKINAEMGRKGASHSAHPSAVQGCTGHAQPPHLARLPDPAKPVVYHQVDTGGGVMCTMAW
jgi:hypothetical protein